MKDYIDIAKQYFKALEGLHLYPPIRSAWALAWMITLTIWVASIVWFFGNITSDDGPGFWIVIVPEVIWLLVVFRIKILRRERLLSDTNLRFGTSFSSPEECRRHLLAVLLKRPPSGFLTVAKEIDDLTLLQKTFRKPSDLRWSEIGRTIYDRDSKSRLLTLLIIPVSMIVTLIAKSDASLDTLFEVLMDPGIPSFLAFLIALAAGFFALFVGIQTLTWMLMDGLTSWSTKLLGTSQRWVLGYLVRDLALYHRGIDSAQDAKDEVAATNASTSITQERPSSEEHPSPQLTSPSARGEAGGARTSAWSSPYQDVQYDSRCFFGSP